jgi:lipopolysaccharide transport system ATP-binding protein
MNVVISTRDLGKRFYRKKFSQFKKNQTLKHELLDSRSHITPWALHGITFDVRAGEMLGVIGTNGAGKSTLLRLLGGIGKPTIGKISMIGRVGGLLELGGGFHGDLSGRENVIIAGIVAGLLRKEIQKSLDQIVSFAELEEIIDQPVRTYSTGMLMRLAFSVAVHTDPDILLIDEYLSVGDLAFQAKCSARISKMRDNGCAMVLVSHGMDQIKSLCNHCLWLRRGEVVDYGPASAITDSYFSEVKCESLKRTPWQTISELPSVQNSISKGERFGSMEIIISNIVVESGRRLSSGSALKLNIFYSCNRLITEPIFSVSLLGSNGDIMMDVNTRSGLVLIPDLIGSGYVTLVIERIDLTPGIYSIDIGIFEREWTYAYDYQRHAEEFEIVGQEGQKGFLSPPAKWKLGNSSCF